MKDLATPVASPYLSSIVVKVAPFGHHLRIMDASHRSSATSVLPFLAAFFALSNTRGHSTFEQEYLPVTGTITLPTPGTARICRHNSTGGYIGEYRDKGMGKR